MSKHWMNNNSIWNSENPTLSAEAFQKKEDNICTKTSVMKMRKKIIVNDDNDKYAMNNLTYSLKLHHIACKYKTGSKI